MKIKVWVSYANKDRAHLQKLKDEVKRADGLLPIEWLTDERNKAGEMITREIISQINEADTWILLLSQAFSESPYCLNSELPLIKLRAEDGKRRLLPVMLNRYQSQPDLDRLIDAYKGVGVIGFRAPILDKQEKEDERWKLGATEIVELLRPVAVAKRLIPPAKLKDLKSDVLTGGLTPFLGPACCDIRENYEPAMPHLRSRLKRLLNKLSKDGDKSAQAYAISIAASRRLMMDGDVRVDGNPDDLPVGFLEMHAAIACLGAAACAVFGDALGRGYQGLTDTRNYSVALDGKNPLVRTLAVALFRAVLAAKAVPEKSACLIDAPNSPHPCLGTQGMWWKLVTLASSLFEGDQPTPETTDDALDAWSRSLDTTLRDRGNVRGLGRMTLGHLEWIGDLLWHTTRFDAPIFPSPDDLSFQLSLCACSPQCIARMPLGLATAVCDYKDYEPCFSKIVKHFEKLVAKNRKGKQKRSLPGSLAAMLERASGQPGKAKLPARKRGGAITAVQDHSQKKEEGPQPMLLSSNLDRDIECRLAVKGRYFVLFPVNYEEGGRPGIPHNGQQAVEEKKALPLKPGWMLMSKVGKEPPRYYYVDVRARLSDVVDKLHKAGEWDKWRGKPGNSLPGPLIVRLRGAPLEPPPDGVFEQILCRGAESELRGNTKFRHRILLSCHEFSRELIGLNSLPECVRELMSEDRVLCFLGHVLDEPDSLVGLQTDVWLRRRMEADGTGAESTNGRQEERVSIGCGSFGDVHATMLSRMGVIPLPIELDNVGRDLAEILGKDGKEP